MRSFFAVGTLCCILASSAAAQSIRAEIKEISGEHATINAGKTQGVRQYMVFDIYKQARSIQIPITQEVIVNEMAVCATLVVISVQENSSICRIENFQVVGGEVRTGQLVMENKVKNEQQQNPVILEFNSTLAAVGWNQTAKLTLNVKDPNGGPLVYRWSCSAGALAYDLTMGPENMWTGPLKDGKCEIKVTVRDETNLETTATKELRALGPVGPWKPGGSFTFRGTLGDQSVFSSVADIAFDGTGAAYVLDSEKRMVYVFDAGWVFRAEYGPYSSDNDFVRLEIHKGRGYFLDRYTRSVRMYPLQSKTTFVDNKPVIFGKSGSYGVNGELVEPIDLAVTSIGEVYVLDRQTGAAQLYGVDGEFLLSLGSKANGSLRGQLESPSAIAVDNRDNVAILDNGSVKKIVVFENFRVAKEIRIADAKEAMVGIDFDPITGMLFTLSNVGDDPNLKPIKALKAEERAQVAAFGYQALRGAEFHAMKTVSRIKVSATGEVFVISNASEMVGREIFRYRLDDKGRWYLYGKWGGERNNFAYITKISADAAGNVAGLAPDVNMVLVYDRMGWITAKFGHIGTGLESLRRGIDIAYGSDGSIYVLDGEIQKVKKYNGRGVFEKELGFPGEGGNQISEPKDLAAADGHVFVLCERESSPVVRINNDNAAIGIPKVADGQLPDPVCLVARDKSDVICATDDEKAVRRYVDLGRGGFDIDASYTPHTLMNVFTDLEPIGPKFILFVGEDSSFGGLYYVGLCDERLMSHSTIEDGMRTTYPVPTDGAADGFGTIYILDASADKIAILRAGP